ncbi:NAD-dependent protein deacetylase sirtuin 2 [Chloropicon primus]|uniref:NAD-dependent protein deacetylase n=2 Tax=Chloropicon primus TaxID=1764295 RepID=A0A5B8MRZ8_9CHLO|nr:NAD-dependent protein deacetylase sirtuin 2 [Chloropicon primus]UPR01272.1 NAD-dependent protein deacetylase sirtuin 2 [Chloropicon primus]|eukprot:QDZ22052.1 NAD-dependent protein deacetylase sirtuin 2 [Chloropicon primus]
MKEKGEGEEARGPTVAELFESESESEGDGGMEEFLMNMLNLKLGSPREEEEDLSATPLLTSFDLDGVAEYIQRGECKNVIVLAGAGISVSAGIPDFRSPGSGLYSKLAEYGLPHPEAIFELDFFRNNPDPFYTLAQELFPGNRYHPTPAHYFIKLLHEKGILLRCFTQNIDSLETQAGLPREKLVAAHGNFDSATCIDTGKKVPIDEVERAIFDDSFGWKSLGKKHGGLVKPDIVFFGEQLPSQFFKLAEEDFPKCDLLIVMGTSLVVQPFASLIGRVSSKVPRLLINREKVGVYNKSKSYAPGIGQYGFRFDKNNYRDALFLGDCDKGVEELSDLLGWAVDLRTLIESR